MLDNVLYARAYTSDHQMELLDYAAAKFHEEMGVFKLLVWNGKDLYFILKFNLITDNRFNYGIVSC
jgi:hypothetical protein